MWKPLVVLAIVANTALIIPSEGTSCGPYPENSNHGNPHRKCKEPNQIYDLCPNPCPPRECGVDKTVILCAPAPKPGSKDCKPGCRCADGYLKNRAGVCIPEKECKYDCAKNETLDRCYSECPPRYCGVNIAAVSCLAIDERDCVRGCRCSDGYLRNAEGNCVLEKDCPQCPNENETYDVCPAPCPPRRCDVDETLIDCIPGPRPGDPDCEPGCRCADGYVRNPYGVCVTRDQCPKCPGLNEMYDICPNPCPPQRCGVDPSVIRCRAPPKPGDPECEPGCRCIDGYVRNKDEICIPRDECPENRCIGEHEQYSRCPAFACRPQNCTQVGFPQPCPHPGPDPSRCPGEPGCICEYGYARNSRGKCIPLKKCPSCGGDRNARSGCGLNCGKHCSERNNTEAVGCTTECKENGCDCRKGYWLDDNTGKCVRAEDCTPTCGRNEVYSACVNGECGPQKCSELGFPIACPSIDPDYCIKGCICREGYVRAKNGTCIPKEKCLSCGGDFNAEPGCDENCTKRCPGPKPAKCKCYKDSCVCKDGFVYDPMVKKCVRLEQCTPPCGKNEVLSNCSNGGCGPWRCTDVGFPTGCVKMDQKYCTVGCVCKERYVRDDNEVCIPITDCPECGGDPNAISGCGVNCGRLCSNYKHSENVSCITVCYDNACDCRKGYVLDENINKCVRPKQCTPVCGKNEVFSECANGGCQAKNCSQMGEPIPCVKPAKCKPGCLCAEGFLRDAFGVCIPKDQCPPKCTGANEIYDPCPPSCPPQTCESIGQKYFCPLMPAHKTSKDCHGACRCKPNFFRNKIGECISAKNCLKCRGKNEYFSCGGACDNVCATLSKQNKTNCPIINIQCNEMCYCEDGYARDQYNTCIPIERCPRKCGENERWEVCPATLCEPQSCSDLGFDLTCDFDESKPCPGPPGCVCDYNFVRNENGKCIPKKECPSCGGDPHAESGCGLNCGRLCSNYDKGPVPCPRICYPNACDCKKGYVFDSNTKKCVRPKHCTPVCKEHEVYSECTNGGCQARNCSQLGQPVPCIKLDPKSCIKGCVCEDGYLRARNGTCVPVDKCDNCNKPHEHYDPCAKSCPPETCESIGREYDCPPTAAVCRGACRCDKGYFRNKIGECIRKRDCLKCTGPREYWSCGSACDNVCATLYKQNQTNCPIKNIKCTEMCYCEEGYARNKYNVCIPIEKCPKPRCGINERLEECPPGLCTPQKCSQLGFPISCPDLPEYGCPEPPGCVCIDNYVRDYRGRCIPSQYCPSCGGDPHAISGCGVNCGRTCSTYNRTDVACPAVCYFNACDCRKGYVFDDNLKKCVRPEHCTPTCGTNEIYVSCANGGCGKWNCSQLGQPDLCIDPIECIGGCICQEGYLRTENGDCVPINQCPEPPCGKNERFEFCPDSVCEPQFCTEVGFPLTCSAITHSSCAGEPSCICDYGFVRNEYGDCIPKYQCPSCGGDTNATSGCGFNCGRLCSNYKEKDVICPLYCKINGCDCKKGYVFDSNINKCVLPKDCTPTCRENEFYDFCANGGCQMRNCSQLGGPMLCIDPIECIGGCVCQEGFLRNEKNGDCVPEYLCPLECTKPHEIYDPCPRTCPPQTCAAIGIAYPCPNPPEGKEFCRPACRCENGYYRNSAGECISGEDCLKCMGPNEHYSCGPPCDNVCATLETQNQTHCPYVNKKCTPQCYCDEGYARDDNDICIPIDQCGVSCHGDPNAMPGCGGHCGNRCSNYNKGVVACPLICMIDGCDCKQSYVFDDNLGKCVQPEECTPVCGEDEVYNNCVNGGCQKKKCSDLARPDVCIHPKECKDGCLCKEGMLRANNGTCVLIDDCPTPICPENEVFDRCSNGGCNRRKCSELTDPVICKDPSECIGDCVCIKGFLRNENGFCVPESECNPQCDKPHQVFNPCPSSCPPQTCESLERAYICPIEWGQELPCQPGCVCEEGYFFNLIGECVSQENCLKCNGPHEYFSCGQECDNVCATLSEQNKTNCPIINIQCSEQCYCEDGYARNGSNICIPIEECPVECYGEHKVFDPCPKSPRTCENLINGESCESSSSSEEQPCEPGCVCEEGYYENAIGECLTKRECLKCPGPNEYYSCGGACDNVCETLNEQSQDNCPIINIKCNEMCYCKKGYARNASNICIPIEDCPPSRCGPDERYEESPYRVCEPLTCCEVGMDLECPPVEDDDCDDTPGCICKSGLVRNDEGVCIPISECCE